MSYATIFLGIPIFFVQQYVDVQRTKSERSLVLVERFSAADLLIARNTVQAPWRDIPVPELISEGMDRETFDTLVMDLVGGDPDLQRSIFQIIDFFESAQLCVQAGLCDEELLMTFSQGYATEFHCTYGAYIDELRETLGANATAEGLRSFLHGDPEC